MKQKQVTLTKDGKEITVFESSVNLYKRHGWTVTGSDEAPASSSVGAAVVQVKDKGEAEISGAQGPEVGPQGGVTGQAKDNESK